MTYSERKYKAATVRYLKGDGYNFDTAFWFKTDISDIINTKAKRNAKYSRDVYNEKIMKT